MRVLQFFFNVSRSREKTFFFRFHSLKAGVENKICFNEISFMIFSIVAVFPLSLVVVPCCLFMAAFYFLEFDPIFFPTAHNSFPILFFFGNLSLSKHLIRAKSVYLLKNLFYPGTRVCVCVEGLRHTGLGACMRNMIAY